MPFRLAALAILIAGGFVAWSYRRELRRMVHEWTAESGPPRSSGRADAALLGPVMQRIGELGARGRARDSVVLSAAEVASLLALSSVDSAAATLDVDDLELVGIIETRGLSDALGPLRGVVAERERLLLGGPLNFRRPGLAEWRIERARVHGVPVPREVVVSLLRRITRGATGEAGVFPVPLPEVVGGLRVAPQGLVLYGVAGRRDGR